MEKYVPYIVCILSVLTICSISQADVAVAWPISNLGNTIVSGQPDYVSQSSYMTVGKNDAGDICRTLLKWDVASMGVPLNAQIVEATISLRIQYDASIWGLIPEANKVSVHRLLQSYVPGSVTWNHYTASDTWNSAGASAASDSAGDNGAFDRAASALRRRKAGYAGYTMVFDVTEAAKKWVAGEWQNNGLIFIADNETDSAAFRQFLLDAAGGVSGKLQILWEGKEAGSKVIQFGWDTPDSRYVRDHLEQLSASPFDGIVIGVRYVDGNPGRLGGSDMATWHLFDGELDDTTTDQAIADLENLGQSLTLKHNFIQALPGHNHVNWFDDSKWGLIANNFANAAKVAYQSGCKGLWFDIEDYGSGQFNWFNSPVRGLYSLAEHNAKARQRGREIMAAVNSEFPGINFYFAFGLSLRYYYDVTYGHPENYDLIPGFFDGLYEQADTGTIITDGYEFSYYSYTEQEFIDARDYAFNNGRVYSSVPDEYDSHTQVGFATFLDAQSSSRGWNGVVENYNYYNSSRLQNALYYSMKYTDKYSFMYHERSSFWSGGRINPNYNKAVYYAHYFPGDAPGAPPAVPPTKLLDGYETAPLSSGVANTIKTLGPNQNLQSTTVNLGYYSPDGVSRALMKWDVAAVTIPDNTQMTRAVIEFVIDYDSSYFGIGPIPVGVKAYRLLRPYNVGQVTWNDASAGSPWGQPGASAVGVDRDPTAIATAYALYQGSSILLDLSEAYKNWNSGNWNNYGILLEVDFEDSGASFKQISVRDFKVSYDYPPDPYEDFQADPGFSNMLVFNCIPFAYYKIYRSSDGVNWQYLDRVLTTADTATYIDTRFPDHYFPDPMIKRYYQVQYDGTTY